jgi:hypothetical protein
MPIDDHVIARTTNGPHNQSSANNRLNRSVVNQENLGEPCLFFLRFVWPEGVENASRGRGTSGAKPSSSMYVVSVYEIRFATKGSPKHGLSQNCYGVLLFYMLSL